MFSSDNDSDDNEFVPIRRGQCKPKRPPKPHPEQVEMLQQSDFYRDTQNVLGDDLKTSHRFDVQHNVLNVIQNRHVAHV